MNYLQSEFKGKKVSDLLEFIDELEIDGGWIVHPFCLISTTNKPLYYFQLYNDANGALILIKTHRILCRTFSYLDMEIINFYDPSKFICDKIYTRSIGRVDNAYDISNFIMHIEILLLS